MCLHESKTNIKVNTFLPSGPSFVSMKTSQILLKVVTGIVLVIVFVLNIYVKTVEPKLKVEKKTMYS